MFYLPLKQTNLLVGSASGLRWASEQGGRASCAASLATGLFISSGLSGSPGHLNIIRGGACSLSPHNIQSLLRSHGGI